MKEPSADSRKAFWERVHQESPIAILGAVKEGARQLVPICAALQALYFVAVAGSGIKTAFEGTALLVLFGLPVLAWLVCLALAVSLFVPESHSTAADPTPAEIERVYRDTARRKLRRLRLAQWLLVSSLVLLGLDFLIYLAW